MRLPWEQLAMEVIEVSALELGDKLYPDLEPELAEAAAGWGIVHLVKWALARCPEHQPPSASALVPGPTAARQVARAARYRGKPEVFIAAASSLPNPVVEVAADGIRLRGLDRYDEAWGDRHRVEWRAWKAARPDRYPPTPRRTSGGDTAETRRTDPDPDPDAERDADAAPERDAHADAHHHRDDEVEISSAACWDAFKRLRSEQDPPLAVELHQPKNFGQWHDSAIAEGFKPHQLATAYVAYLLDDDFRLKGWPTALFMSDGIWRIRTSIPPPRKRRGAG